MRLTISFLLIMIINSVFGQDNLYFNTIYMNSEWKNTKKPFTILVYGLIVLIGSAIVLGLGNSV